MKENLILDRTYKFALRIVKVYQCMHKNKEFILSKQLLKSGTSIGANVEEAMAVTTRKDFIFKMSIASREARETIYWLRLLKDSGILDKSVASNLINECVEIKKILTSIVKTTSEKYNNKN